MRKLTVALLLFMSWPALAAPFIYDLEYQVRTAESPSSIYGDITIGDTFHVNLVWDWDLARGGPAADKRTLSNSMASYDTDFGNFEFTDTSANNVLLSRVSGTSTALVEDWEPTCRFTKGDMAGTECLANGLFVDEIIFQFGCADWTASTHVLHSLECSSGMTGYFGFGLKDFSGLGSAGGFIADLRSITAVPEPAPWALLAGGRVCLGFFRSRRQTDDAPQAAIAVESSL